MSRRQITITVVIGIVFIAVLSVVYLQISSTAGAYRTAWVATRDLEAGQVLAAGSVHQVRIPSSGDSFTALDSSPTGRRLAHRVDAGGLLRGDDLLPSDTVEVPVSLKVAAGVGAGDKVDVYASVGGHTVLIARGLVLESSTVALVPAADEAFWITLAGSSTTLLAARSTGLDVAIPSSGVSVDDAIRHLAGVARGEGIAAAGAASPSPAP
jgi:hypothetical protein